MVLLGTLLQSLLGALMLAVGLVLPGCEPAADSGSAATANTVRTDTTFSKEYLMGRFDPAKHPDFCLIDPGFAGSEGMYLRRDVYDAFRQMHDAALRDGVKLRIVSATRTFSRQKAIWENKWNGKTLVEGGVDLTKAEPDPVRRALRILRFSSMPGTSRHHWGTDIDLNSLENEWFASGEGLRLYQWLQRHAGTFGFCQTYTEKGADRPFGYEEEKWHWSWTPLSSTLTRLASETLKDQDIRGFQGDMTADSVRMVERYVLGINPACR